MTRYDKIVVGAGSAGCVLANRLSGNPDLQVLLIEAGPIFPIDDYPQELMDADKVTTKSRFTWGYRSEPDRAGASFDAAAARVAGGGSAINAGIIRRGRRDDFQRWSRHGLKGWSFDEVLPTYIAIESAPDYQTPEHGRSGLLPVRQLHPEDSTVALNAFVDAGAAEGFSRIEDFNVGSQHGVALQARNVVDGRRINTGIAYLSAEVRGRSNLHLKQDTQVDRVEFEGICAVGVRLVNGEVLTAQEIILCSGAYGTPAILLRSGVGPAEDLTKLGIEVVANLPVGKGLRDHPVFSNDYTLKDEFRDVHPARGATLATRSSYMIEDGLDLWVFATNILDPADIGRATLKLGAAVMLPLSVGAVRLRSRDPRDLAIIDFNLLAEPADRQRMLEAVRLSQRLAMTPALAAIIDHANSQLEDLQDDESLLLAIEKKLITFYHSCCTARMGVDDDPEAVTNASGCVRQVAGLRVVDASIFPDIVSVPLNLTTIMVAERIARIMLDEVAVGPR